MNYFCFYNKIMDESIIKQPLESIKLDKNNLDKSIKEDKNNLDKSIKEEIHSIPEYISTKQNTIEIDIINFEKKLNTKKLYKLLNKKIIESFNKSIIKKNDEAISKNNYKSLNSITPYVDIDN